ncbi:phage holin family protein, partial [Clostridium botulinum]|nr:phage holin family protein [Clostridium botulinum]
SVKDKYITVALMIFAIVFSMILSRPSATAFLQGVLCWGVAVGLNQTGKQLNKQE